MPTAPAASPLERPLRISPGPRRARLLTGGLVFTGVWALAASYGLFFRDDVVTGLIGRQRTIRTTYEVHLSQMQADLDRARVERAGAATASAARLAAALERQAELERRQATLRGLSGRAYPADPAETGALADPLPDRTEGLVPQPDGRRLGGGVEEGLAELEGRLDGLQADQALGLEAFTQGAAAELRRLRGAIGRTGLDPARFEAPVPEGVGGPLVPLAPDPFADALDAAQRTAGENERLRRVVETLPLRRPVAAGATLSSGFGVRLDPFTRGLALHTGLDFKAEAGAPARATAPGRVSAAESAGGYGRMVEVDHGNGVVTRFAHFAQVWVQPGQHVRAGEVVGLVGSTGRSTGAHLHYETRIDGEPVDPERFLDAGRRLAEDYSPE